MNLRDLNLFERAVASVNPEWGLRRLNAKLALDLSRSMLQQRGFDGARRDRRTAGWQASGGSAASELAPALDTLRKRSRDLVRNNEWANNAKRKTVAHVIGTGFIARPVDATKAARKRATSLWNEFSERCDPQGMADFPALQARIAGEVFEAGACFVRWYARPPEFGLKVPLQCEVLEHEHLDTLKTEVRGENVIINGVEFDTHGRRVAYWLFPQHPGDFSVISRGRYQSERIPAHQVDHVFRVDRPGQVTGVPWLAPTMLRLRDTADFEEARLIQQKIAACLTVFIKREHGSAQTLAGAKATERDETGARIEKIGTGMVGYLQPGEEPFTVNPPAVTGYGEYMRAQMHAGAAGVGLTHAQFSGDLTAVNYSGLREGKLDFWAVLDQHQYHMVVPQVMRPAWRRVMGASAARGHAISADIRGEFTPPRRPWVDPLKDVKATGEELALGLESWEELVAARGYDPEDRREKLIAERKALAEAGIIFGQTPGLFDQGQQDAQNAQA